MNRLVYGKDETSNIVSIEPNDDKMEVFIEKDGQTISKRFTNEYWILASKPLSKDWVKLDGELHYKYGKLYSNKSNYFLDRKVFKYNKEDTYSLFEPKEAAMVKDGFTYYKGLKHTEISILCFDIESTTLKHDPVNSKILIISNTLRKNGVITRKLFCYDDYANQAELLQDWCTWVCSVDPSIIAGHNIYMYDLPYMDYIAKQNNIYLELGRNSSRLKFEEFQRDFRKDSSQFLHYNRPHIYGREIVDTMFLSIKYDVAQRKYKNYGLKNIINQENLEDKDRVFYDSSKIRFNYQNKEEWEKIKQYALHDADDVLKLYDLMAPPFFYMTQMVPKPFQTMIESASGSQINLLMLRSYLQEGHSIPADDETNKFEGAISFGTPGIFNNAFKVDVASLYPSIMLEYKIYSKEKDPNGNMLNLLKYLTEKRLEYKKLAKNDPYYDHMQNAFKIGINSIYGFMGATGLNFNYPKGAAEVTKYGREILTKAVQWAEDNQFKVINGDTDSIMFCKHDQSPFNEEEQNYLLNGLNSLYPEKIHWEHDGVYKSVIVVKTKNYILYDGKKIKQKGSAIKATTKEPALKEFIDVLLLAILENKNNYEEIYNNYVLEIFNIQDILRWSSKKTVTESVLNPKRTNEQKIKDAIADIEVLEGDKIYLYFTKDDKLKRFDLFEGDHDPYIMLKKLYKTAQIFNTVLDTKTLFPDYSLKKHKLKLSELICKDLTLINVSV